MKPSARALFVVLAIGSAAAKPVDTDPPVILHKAPGSVPRGVALDIVADIRDPAGVFGPTLYFRRVGTGNFSTSSMTEVGGKYIATIPASAVSVDIEYFIESFDNEGNGPARMGTPEKPLRARVGPPAPVAPPAPAPVPRPEPQVDIKAPEAKPEPKVAAAKPPAKPGTPAEKLPVDTGWGDDDVPKKTTVVKVDGVPATRPAPAVLQEEPRSGSGKGVVWAVFGIGLAVAGGAVAFLVINGNRKGPIINEVDVSVPLQR